MMDGTNNETLLLRFPPCLRKNIKEVWAGGKIGVYEMEYKCIVLMHFQRHIRDEYKPRSFPK